MLLSASAAAAAMVLLLMRLHSQDTLRADVAPIIKRRSRRESARGRRRPVDRHTLRTTISCQPPAGLSNNYGRTGAD